MPVVMLSSWYCVWQASSTHSVQGAKLYLSHFERISDLCDSVMVPAVPVIRQKLGMTDAEAVWLVSAFNLTSASFLLLSGRVSDVFDPS
jgi:MFS family permease